MTVNVWVIVFVNVFVTVSVTVSVFAPSSNMAPLTKGVLPTINIPTCCTGSTNGVAKAVSQVTVFQPVAKSVYGSW